jgi:hypothetical protein
VEDVKIMAGPSAGKRSTFFTLAQPGIFQKRALCSKQEDSPQTLSGSCNFFETI